MIGVGISTHLTLFRPFGTPLLVEEAWILSAHPGLKVFVGFFRENPEKESKAVIKRPQFPKAFDNGAFL